MVDVSQSADYVIVLEQKSTSSWCSCFSKKDPEPINKKHFDFNKHFMRYYLNKKLGLKTDRHLFEFKIGLRLYFVIKFCNDLAVDDVAT